MFLNPIKIEAHWSPHIIFWICTMNTWLTSLILLHHCITNNPHRAWNNLFITFKPGRIYSLVMLYSLYFNRRRIESLVTCFNVIFHPHYRHVPTLKIPAMIGLDSRLLWIIWFLLPSVSKFCKVLLIGDSYLICSSCTIVCLFRWCTSALGSRCSMVQIQPTIMCIYKLPCIARSWYNYNFGREPTDFR